MEHSSNFLKGLPVQTVKVDFVTNLKDKLGFWYAWVGGVHPLSPKTTKEFHSIELTDVIKFAEDLKSKGFKVHYSPAAEILKSCLDVALAV